MLRQKEDNLLAVIVEGNGFDSMGECAGVHRIREIVFPSQLRSNFNALACAQIEGMNESHNSHSCKREGLFMEGSYVC